MGFAEEESKDGEASQAGTEEESKPAEEETKGAEPMEEEEEESEDEELGSPPEGTVHYLVKWRSLQYEDATWELAKDVEAQKIAEFQERRYPKVPYS